MEWRKVKNIILLLLLLVNVSLLVLVLSRRMEALAYERSALDQAVEALANSGIRTEAGLLAPADGLSPLSFERDTAREDALVSALLGEALTGDNRGGGLYLYQCPAGEASFRSGGELSMTAADGSRWQTGDPVGHAAGLLEQMGLPAEQISLTVTEDGTEVVFRQLWEGRPLFPCQVVFSYRGGQLRSVAGTLLVAGAVTQETGDTLTLPTALMRFLDGILGSGEVCSAIRSMEPGYRPSQSYSGITRLNPVWLVSTNTADYYLDAVTGALTRADMNPAALAPAAASPLVPASGE